MKASFIKKKIIHLFVVFYFPNFVYDFSNIKSDTVNVMSCHESKEQNKAGDDEVEEYKGENEVTRICCSRISAV